MPRSKIRIRFRKDGDLRLVSHHDLLRCFERMLRRAELPYRSSEGFNPKPRLVFALSLALGIVGRDEIADLELTDELPADDVRDRLARQAPAGLTILAVETVAPKAPLQVRQVTYRVPLPPERWAKLRDQATELLSSNECWVQRPRRRGETAGKDDRRLDLRPYILGLRVDPESLEMDLRVTPTGSARPEEVLQRLGAADLLEAGAVLERTCLELHVPDDDCSSPGTEPLENHLHSHAAAGIGETGEIPPAPDDTAPEAG